MTDPGFGSYWTVNLEAPPGTKRPRKRGRPNANKDTPGAPGVDPKRRGRPPKTAGAGTSALMHQEAQPDDDDFAMDEDVDEDHYASEGDGDDVPATPQRPQDTGISNPISGGGGGSAPGPSPYGARNGGYGGGYKPGPEEIDNMYAEIQSLRRQSGDAVALSIRLTDQLSQAQSEVSEARNMLRAVETRLSEEMSKLRDAERANDDERARRLACETELKELRAKLEAKESAAMATTS